MKLRAPGAALLTLALFACDSADPTGIDRDGGPIVRFSSSGGGTALPIPSLNTNEPGFGSYGSLPEMDAGVKAAGKWAEIRVIGAIGVSTNPALLACDPSVVTPYDGANIGPLGHPSNTSVLKVGMRAAGRTLYLELDGDSTRTRLRYPIYSDTNTTIRASRGALLGSKSCGGQTHPNYALSGSQIVEIEELPDPAVIATETVLPQADTVEFIAVNVPRGLNPVWWFRTGDTLSTPAGGTTSSITACQGKPSCSYKVTQSGRMYTRYLNGLGGSAYHASDVVWVGRTVNAAVSLTCNPYAVAYGSEVSCSVASNPATDSMQVLSWSYNADGYDSVCAAGVTVCSFVPAVSGSVHVRVMLGGAVQAADSHVYVFDYPATCDSSVSLRVMSAQYQASSENSGFECLPPLLLPPTAGEEDLEVDASSFDDNAVACPVSPEDGTRYAHPIEGDSIYELAHFVLEGGTLAKVEDISKGRFLGKAKYYQPNNVLSENTARWVMRPGYITLTCTVMYKIRLPGIRARIRFKFAPAGSYDGVIESSGL